MAPTVSGTDTMKYKADQQNPVFTGRGGAVGGVVIRSPDGKPPTRNCSNSGELVRLQ